jgi:hypothetical protein
VLIKRKHLDKLNEIFERYEGRLIIPLCFISYVAKTDLFSNIAMLMFLHLVTLNSVRNFIMLRQIYDV